MSSTIAPVTGAYVLSEAASRHRQFFLNCVPMTGIPPPSDWNIFGNTKRIVTYKGSMDQDHSTDPVPSVKTMHGPGHGILAGNFLQHRLQGRGCRIDLVVEIDCGVAFSGFVGNAVSEAAGSDQQVPRRTLRQIVHSEVCWHRENHCPPSSGSQTRIGPVSSGLLKLGIPLAGFQREITADSLTRAEFGRQMRRAVKSLASAALISHFQCAHVRFRPTLPRQMQASIFLMYEPIRWLFLHP